MADFAAIVTEGRCVWFVGSGFSRPALPSATDLAKTMLDNAFIHQAASKEAAYLIWRWETLKLVLAALLW